MIHEILVKTQYALLLPVDSKIASMEQVLMTVPFDYSVTGPSTTGDLHSVFNDAQVIGHFHCCFGRSSQNVPVQQV